jgi:hypothetical protein
VWITRGNEGLIEFDPATDSLQHVSVPDADIRIVPYGSEGMKCPRCGSTDTRAITGADKFSRYLERGSSGSFGPMAP